jgi:hypothetical protein
MLKIDYIEIDGLYYPKLTPKFNETPLGKYGRMRKRYLEEYKQELYMRLLISNKLIDYLIDLNERAKQLLYNLERAYLKKYPLTNDDYLKDLHTRYQARAYAEEIVLHDIVYSDDN